MKEQNKTHHTGFTRRGLQDTAIMIPKDCVRNGWRCSKFHEVYILNLPSSLISLEVKECGSFQQNLLLFSCSVMFNSLQYCGLQHARLPVSSQSPGVCSNSCPLHQWCHPTISSSVISFSSSLQSFPASGSFQMHQFFASGGQKYWSFSFSISPSNG